MRLAAPKLYQHLRNLVLERRLVHTIVGALTQHERLDHRAQRVWLQIVGRHSDGGDLLAATLPFKFDRKLALVLHLSQRYTMAVARVVLATREDRVRGLFVDGPVRLASQPTPPMSRCGGRNDRSARRPGTHLICRCSSPIVAQ